MAVFKFHAHEIDYQVDFFFYKGQYHKFQISHGALQSVQHTTLSVLRLLIWIRKKLCMAQFMTILSVYSETHFFLKSAYHHLTAGWKVKLNKEQMVWKCMQLIILHQLCISVRKLWNSGSM